MKWFKDIFQKVKAKAGDKVAAIGLSDLNAWLDEMGKDPESEKRLSDIYVRIEKVSKDLAEDVNSLNAAAPDENAPPRLLRAGLAARGEVIKQMNALLEKLVLPQRAEIESAAEYHSNLVNGLGRTVTKFGRAQQFMAALFPKEAERINSELNRLSHLLVELDQEIVKRQESMDGIRIARDLLARVQEERAEAGDLSSSIKNSEKSLAELRDAKSAREEELKRIASSEEGRRAEDLRKTLDLKREDLSRIESQMSDLVAPLNKALARIIKQEASDRLSLQHSNVFEQLSRSPEQVIDKDISGALQELRSNVDILGLKDRKREKILERIDNLIEEKSLEALKAGHTDILRQINELQPELERSHQRSVELEKELDGIGGQIRRFEADLDQERKNFAALEARETLDETDLKMAIEKLAGSSMEIELER